MKCVILLGISNENMDVSKMSANYYVFQGYTYRENLIDPVPVESLNDLKEHISKTWPKVCAVKLEATKNPRHPGETYKVLIKQIGDYKHWICLGTTDGDLE